jgi:hypothetical protein
MKRCILLLVIGLNVSCFSTVYYETMEQFGDHKRDILVARGEEASDSQKAAKVQFTSALDQFSELLNFNGGRPSGHL